MATSGDLPSDGSQQEGDVWKTQDTGDFYAWSPANGWVELPGLTAVKGQKGNAGEKGEKGEVGPKGDKGEIGDDLLETLIKGNVLPKGSTPEDLANSLKGDKGEKGQKGEKGKGEKGEVGEGEKGQKGEIGPEGVKGALVLISSLPALP